MHPSTLTVLSSPALDGGNTGANVYGFVAPCKLVIDRVVLTSQTDLSSNLHVSCDSYIGTTQTNEDIASLELASGQGTFSGLVDYAGRGISLNAGNKILVQVDNAGDSGENFQVHIVARAYDERQSNMSLTETA